MGSKQGTEQKRSKEGLAIGLTILVVVVVGAAIAYNALAGAEGPGANLQGSQQSSAAQQANPLAPDFEVEAADGTLTQLSQLKGAPVVLNFWASTCGPCQSEMPGFQAAFKQYGDQLQFMMVDIPGFNGETVERAKRFLQDNSYTFPAYFDTQGRAAAAFGLSSLPRTYFIDAQGAVVASAAGALDEQVLQEGIDLLL
ncbi:MAG: TlpA family protein disulfide reductase [Eggerthellaceae bacterium]|jgi:thiol-disulfide isomerase/thioredoxin|nr:TlpA family protein disulfide reductase [Eggerthellaceae bacterium]